MDIGKSAELLRIYTLEHGKEMTPDELDAHKIAGDTMNTFLRIQHQCELIRRKFDKASSLVSAKR